jgi:hypothetical protein
VKLILATLAYLGMAALLGWGILLAVAGQPVVLIVVFLFYLIAFAKFGCLPQH